MGGTHSSLFRRVSKITAGLLVFLTVFASAWPGFLRSIAPRAEAAQVTIDASAAANGTSHISSGSQTVFVDDQTGYKFYRRSTGICVYSKTTDGGANWGSPVTTDSQTDCIAVRVWYDKWTPGSASSSIHIVTMDTGNDDIWYNRLDPSTDTLLLGSSPVSMITNSGQGGNSLTEGENYPAITRGTDGTIYALSNDGTGNNDSFVVECTANCNVATGWTETGTNPFDAASDQNILVPLASGNIMLINRDISADDIRSKIWNNTAWSGTWTTIDANATENATYNVGLAAAVSSTTAGRVYLAYTGDTATLGTDDSVRTAYYNGSTWATTTSVLSSGGSTRAITGVSIGIDAATDNVYVAYSARTTAGTANTGNVYWKWATSTMRNWSSERGPINTSADDIFGVDMNLASDQRLYTTWFDNTDDDIYGDTLIDVFPGVNATTTGSQTATFNAGTTSVHIGGAFVFYNTYKANDITAITITESGSINGSTNIANVKLLYEYDTTVPYDCASVSYNGNESQFGSTDSNGFSGADGVSSFSGTTLTASTTAAACVYPVLDILNTTLNGSTIEISINNPSTDVTVTGSLAFPATSVSIPGTTNVLNDQPTQVHYHWRNDNGSEALATSRTNSTQDTTFPALQRGTSTRLRLEVSNEGGSSTPAIQYRLEYAEASGACSEAVGWTDVGAAGGNFDMHDSPNLTNGSDATNVLSAANGAVTDENFSFLGVNGAVRDTTSETGNITLSSTQFVEFEYSIIASTSAIEGNAYCFRLTDRGVPLFGYDQYPRLNISADVSVTATGTQSTSVNLPATNFYIGGAYAVVENIDTRNVTSITIMASGTANMQNDFTNIRLYYDFDTTAPYNCGSESYDGTEPQYGATSTAFSGAATSTFTGSVAISTTSSLCVYTVFDTTASAQNGKTIEIILPNPSTYLLVSGGGSVSPTTDRNIDGYTTLQGAVLTQTHYHWRIDNGSEATASSSTNGAEDSLVANVAESTPLRLRLQVSNEGSITSASRAFMLEYAAKITTCAEVGAWVNVGENGGAFDLYDSPNLTDGDNTTNVLSATNGAVTDENVSFVSPNSAVKDTSAYVASTTLTSSEFLEAEYSIIQTSSAGYDVDYCFRLSTTQTPLNAYSVYAELSTAPKRDFKIQRNFFNMSGTTQTLLAGTHYTAPQASTSAFIRITNSHFTGAGDTTNGGASQNADDITVYILDPSNIKTSVTFVRTGSFRDTRVSWEIIEFISDPGTDNEMIVRSQSTVTYDAAGTVATGTAASVTDDADVVVFITGQMDPNTASAFNTGQSTAAWNAATNQPVFTRGEAGGDASVVSYAIVEFSGQNWVVQRSEHSYIQTGTAETEPIAAVNSLSRTFVHAQKRMGTGLTGVDEYGHEVWLSSVGQVSYFLESGAGTTTGQTSVAWIIENTQTTSGAMDVIQINNTLSGGTGPVAFSISIGTTLEDTANSSIFVNTRAGGTGTNHPRAIVGATIASTTHFELWRSNTGSNLAYRTEIVTWPTAGLALRQSHYRLYVDNDALTPTDPWPEGGTDLGEDTAITGGDDPLGEGNRVRIRMAVKAQNATLPYGIRAFRLQYGQMVTSCSAIPEGNWQTLGNGASSTVWRGYNAPGTVDDTELSALLLTFSSATGTLEEVNDTSANLYAVPVDGEIEYDWIVEQNGATAETYYCFRMINSDGTPLDRYSSSYPQIRTASFAPRTQNWRWYDDESNETPSVPLGGENVTPADIANGQALKLRVTVKDVKNVAEQDARFKLQYSESANFMEVFDVVATSTCIATSTWCYADGGGDDNAVITTKVLSDVDACSGAVGDGCGTHHESPAVKIGYRHENGAAAEYEFTLQSAGPRVNRVYYFRLYDLVQNLPVSTNSGESYPSLATEGAALTFAMQGLSSTTVVEGVDLDIDTTPTVIDFGTLVPDAVVEGAHRLQVDTNGTEGYQLFMAMTGDFMTSGGAVIQQITGTNASPVAWATGCAVEAVSCLGYHTGDDTLEGGSTRFAALDTYARFSTTTAEEVSYSSQPAVGDTTDIVFRILIRDLQDAGIYETNIEYISVPIF